MNSDTQVALWVLVVLVALLLVVIIARR